MENIRLDRIRILEEKINLKLVEGDFLNLPKLSEQLSDEVKSLTESISNEADLSPNDIDLLEQIKKKIKYFETETFKKFKSYTIKTSKKTKMHNAYKKYGI